VQSAECRVRAASRCEPADEDIFLKTSIQKFSFRNALNLHGPSVAYINSAFPCASAVFLHVPKRPTTCSECAATSTTDGYSGFRWVPGDFPTSL
jgi:hypothetical protein